MDQQKSGQQQKQEAQAPIQQSSDQQSSTVKKSNVWLWILGCCGILLVMGVLLTIFFGALGYNAIKDEINQQETTPSNNDSQIYDDSDSVY